MKKSRKRHFLVVLFCVFLTAALSFVGVCHVKHRRFLTSIEEYTAGKTGICVTVAYVRENRISIACFGENGAEIAADTSVPYEIGSITKTMTGYLIAKAVTENKIDLDDPISKYIGVTPDYDPTIRELCTHSSAYGTYCPLHHFGDELGIINPLYGVDSAVLIQDILDFTCDTEQPGTVYSNFGMATLGLVLEKVNGKYCYDQIMDLCQELGMQHTGLNQTLGREGAWQWDEKDVYIAAGGISSTVEDMLIYAQFCLHHSVAYVDLATTPLMRYSEANQIGFGWLCTNDGRYLWHGGAVNHYNCFLKTNIKTKTSVIVLSNYPATDEIDAADIGDAYLNFIWS